MNFLRSLDGDIVTRYTQHCANQPAEGRRNKNNRANQAPIIADEISVMGADKILAFNKHRSHCSVEQMLMAKYNVTLHYSQMPCIIMYGGRGHKSFYPIETLDIMYYN